MNIQDEVDQLVKVISELSEITKKQNEKLEVIEEKTKEWEEKTKEWLSQFLKKESVEEEVWTPRKGEIVEMSDDGQTWYVQKFVGYDEDCDSVYPFIGDYESFKWCRPLNDPMVIQLIPRVPGDPKPYGDSNNVIVVFESGAYDAANPRDFDWDGDLDEANIVGWFDIT